MASLIIASQGLDLASDFSDALIEVIQVPGEPSDHVHHSRRQEIGAIGKHVGERVAQEAQALAHGYAVDANRAERFYAAVRRYWPGLPDGPKTAAGGPCDFVIQGPEQTVIPATSRFTARISGPHCLAGNWGALAELADIS